MVWSGMHSPLHTTGIEDEMQTQASVLITLIFAGLPGAYKDFYKDSPTDKSMAWGEKAPHNSLNVRG